MYLHSYVEYLPHIKLLAHTNDNIPVHTSKKLLNQDKYLRDEITGHRIYLT